MSCTQHGNSLPCTDCTHPEVNTTLSLDFINETIAHLEELQEHMAYELDENPETHYTAENFNELQDTLGGWYELQDKLLNSKK